MAWTFWTSLGGTGVNADASLKAPGADGIASGGKPLDGNAAAGLDGPGSAGVLLAENA